jgi:hypothetical protein
MATAAWLRRIETLSRRRTTRTAQHPARPAELSAQDLDEFGCLDRKANDHDPKREIDFHRNDQLHLASSIATGSNPVEGSLVPKELGCRGAYALRHACTAASAALYDGDMTGRN